MKQSRKRGRKPKPLEIIWVHRPSADSEFRIQQAFRMLIENVGKSELEAARKKLQEKEQEDQEVCPLGRVGFVPDSDELSAALVDLFRRHGLVLVALVSFLESLVGINVFLPGSVTILTAMSLTAGDPKRALLTLAAILFPSLVAHQLNFAIGKVLGRRSAESAECSGKRVGLWLWLCSTLWHPHFAALTSVVAGSEGIEYRRFQLHFVPVFAAWNLFWGITMYAAGSVVNVGHNLMPLFVMYLVVWMVWDVVRFRSGSA